MKVSCIIPVYNVRRYLSKCIESVLNQSHDDIYIILVNDCSTDGSDKICLRYANRYPSKITVIDKPVNEGVDKARFTGLQHVFDTNRSKGGGDGVIFVDSDDYIEVDSVRQLVEAMIKNDSDVVEMQFNRVLGFVKTPCNILMAPQTIRQPELFDKYYISFFGINQLAVNMCAKLYKTDTLRKAGLSPTGFKMGEDLMFSMRLFPFIQSYTIIGYRGYNYRVGGLTSGYNPTMWHDLKTQYFIKRHEAETHNYPRAYRPLAIELKNILKTELTQRILYLGESEDKLHDWLDGIIKDGPLWQALRDEAGDSSDAVTQGIINTDADTILSTVREDVKRNRMRFIVKKILKVMLK